MLDKSSLRTISQREKNYEQTTKETKEQTIKKDQNKEDIYWREKIEESHFGKVSLSTGRSWDYFKNKILNTYFPTKQVSLSF